MMRMVSQAKQSDEPEFAEEPLSPDSRDTEAGLFMWWRS